MNKNAKLFKVKFIMWNFISRLPYFNKNTKVVGECSRCGECCKVSGCSYLRFNEGHYDCGIYLHPLRKTLNCASYPTNKKSIELAKCPSYSVAEIQIKKIGNSKWPGLNNNCNL